MKKIVLLFIAGLFSCATELVPTELQKGTWFGDNTSMEVTAEGARLEFTCASATITEKIMVDESGNFSVKGTYVQQHGNIPIDYDPKKFTFETTFEGTVVGDEITIGVFSGTTKSLMAKSKLKFGVKDFVKKCP